MLSRNLCACGFALSTVLVTSLSAGQSAYSRPQDPANPLKASLIRTGLYMYSGQTNSLLRMSANGLIVVDGQPAANYQALVSQIQRLSDQPIRLLITTDHHPERTGTNAQFLASGAQKLAQENAGRNMASLAAAGHAIQRPTKTYDREQPISLGGIDVRVMHFGNAHTSGDSVVYFPNLKVVAVGDLFATVPDPDFAAGGTLVGWSAVLSEILKLDFDVVVPGAGPTVTRADLVAFKNKIDTLVSRASDLVKRRVPKTQLMAQLKTDDLGWRLTFTGNRLDRFYAELSRTRE